MKKLTIFLTLVMIVTMPTFAEHVTPETARKVATTFLKNNGAKTTQMSDLSKAAGFPNLYIFSSEQGFVVMAADDCVKPILGYSLMNKFVAERMPENINSWLQSYSDEIQYAIDSQVKASSEVVKQWKDLTAGKSNVAKVTTTVGPLVQTQWDQNGQWFDDQYVTLYNNLCPQVSSGGSGGHSHTGCVATAMAQIMKYWNYPSHGIGYSSYTWKGQTLSADFGSTTYDWNNMTNTYSNSSTDEEKYAVDILMYHCGVSVEMDYDGNRSNGGNRSSASTTKVVSALTSYFNYSSTAEYKEKTSYDNATWIDMLKAELQALRPMQYRGQSRGGHSFVCDGYDNDNNFHFNWGWSGWCDGFYSLDNLQTIDPGTGGGNGIFTDGQAAIFGIQPAQCSASDPTNLTYTHNGLQSLTLNWTAANGAVSYNIYRNNNYVGNSTTNSYTEIAPFGTNVYYVRSVDANGELSLSSNSVSFFVDYHTPVVDDLQASFSGNYANLTWTVPEWCYPETESAILNYGEKNTECLWSSIYYAHRHLAADLAQYAGKAVYKISTYIFYSGTYSVYIYTKSTEDNLPDPNSLVFSNTGVIVTISNGWYEFNMNEPIILTGTDDLWVVMKQEDTGYANPTPSFFLSEHNTNAFYAGKTSPTNLYDTNPNYNCAWLINTYLTDGTYTYNLYQDDEIIAENLSETTYSNVPLNNNAPNLLTVKTNYYGGETSNSNKIGFAKGNTTLASLSLASNDKMTILENSTLTVSDILSNNNSANLVLENSAQLINNSENVQATVKKSVTGHEATDFSGWKFIASPVAENYTPLEANGLLTNNYDLYYYDEPEHLWRNHEGGEYSNFTLSNGQGYLYANDEGTSIRFAGTVLKSSLGTEVESAELSYSESAGDYAGWHLVGNPFACNATINVPCYNAIDNTTHRLSTTAHAANAYSIKPCEAVMVKVTSDGSKVTFKSGEPASNPQPNQLQMTLAQNVVNRDGVSSGSTTIDNAIISFNESNMLEKFVFDTDATKLYIPQNGKDFAIVTSEGIGEMSLNFRAAEDGSFTLTVNPEGVEMNYLHLIDNITGADVDLLTNPSYTFEAKTTDYESRFKLVFASGSVFGDGASTGSASFAFFNNGQWIINNNGESIVQVLDMTGRILRSERVNSGCDIQINYAPGVYVLRLINGEKVRTQKIVIE